MGDHKRESPSDNADELLEPMLGDFSEEAYEGLASLSSEKQAMAEKRRRLEQRLEEKRMREELDDYDWDLGD